MGIFYDFELTAEMEYGFTKICLIHLLEFCPRYLKSSQVMWSVI